MKTKKSEVQLQRANWVVQEAMRETNLRLAEMRDDIQCELDITSYGNSEWFNNFMLNAGYEHLNDASQILKNEDAYIDSKMLTAIRKTYSLIGENIEFDGFMASIYPTLKGEWERRSKLKKMRPEIEIRKEIEDVMFKIRFLRLDETKETPASFTDYMIKNCDVLGVSPGLVMDINGDWLNGLNEGVFVANVVQNIKDFVEKKSQKGWMKLFIEQPQEEKWLDVFEGKFNNMMISKQIIDEEKKFHQLNSEMDILINMKEKMLSNMKIMELIHSAIKKSIERSTKKKEIIVNMGGGSIEKIEEYKDRLGKIKFLEKNIGIVWEAERDVVSCMSSDIDIGEVLDRSYPESVLNDLKNGLDRVRINLAVKNYDYEIDMSKSLYGFMRAGLGATNKIIIGMERKK